MGIVSEEKREASISAPLDGMNQYLQDIRSFPLLDAQEERVLTLRCVQGDQDAIRLLVCSNLRLVVNVAREYAGRGVPLMDLVQEGSVGLLSAAKKFDPQLGFRFSTYATKWIRRGVVRCLDEHGAMIRVPGHTSEKLQKVIRVRAELEKLLGEEPHDEQLADKLDMSLDKLRHMLQLAPKVQSLDGFCVEADLVDDSFTSAPQEQLVREELSRIMDTLLAQLTERQRLILRLHYGLEDGECHSLESISERLQLSKERVRQINQQAMDQLKKNGAAFGLEDFLNE